MASNTKICLYFKFGFCKHGPSCRRKHVQEKCESSDCNGNKCERRHPQPCKYFSIYKRCKFGEYCAYRHDSHVDPVMCEIQTLNTKVEQLQTEINLKNDEILKLLRELSMTGNSHEQSADLLVQENIPQIDGQNSLDELESVLSSPPPRIITSKFIICKTCDLGFTTHEDFRLHDRLQYCCDICGICFPTEDAVYLHEADFHPGIPPTNVIRKKGSL